MSAQEEHLTHALEAAATVVEGISDEEENGQEQTVVVYNTDQPVGASEVQLVQMEASPTAASTTALEQPPRRQVQHRRPYLQQQQQQPQSMQQLVCDGNTTNNQINTGNTTSINNGTVNNTYQLINNSYNGPVASAVSLGRSLPQRIWTLSCATVKLILYLPLAVPRLLLRLGFHSPSAAILSVAMLVAWAITLAMFYMLYISPLGSVAAWSLSRTVSGVSVLASVTSSLAHVAGSTLVWLHLRGPAADTIIPDTPLHRHHPGAGAGAGAGPPAMTTCADAADGDAFTIPSSLPAIRVSGHLIYEATFIGSIEQVLGQLNIAITTTQRHPCAPIIRGAAKDSLRSSANVLRSSLHNVKALAAAIDHFAQRADRTVAAEKAAADRLLGAMRARANDTGALLWAQVRDVEARLVSQEPSLWRSLCLFVRLCSEEPPLADAADNNKRVVATLHSQQVLADWADQQHDLLAAALDTRQAWGEELRKGLAIGPHVIATRQIMCDLADDTKLGGETRSWAHIGCAQAAEIQNHAVWRMWRMEREVSWLRNAVRWLAAAGDGASDDSSTDDVVDWEAAGKVARGLALALDERGGGMSMGLLSREDIDGVKEAVVQDLVEWRALVKNAWTTGEEDIQRPIRT